jgi:hypothetical protein
VQIVTEDVQIVTEDVHIMTEDVRQWEDYGQTTTEDVQIMTDVQIVTDYDRLRQRMCRL